MQKITDQVCKQLASKLFQIEHLCAQVTYALFSLLMVIDLDIYKCILGIDGDPILNNKINGPDRFTEKNSLCLLLIVSKVDSI